MSIQGIDDAAGDMGIECLKSRRMSIPCLDDAAGDRETEMPKRPEDDYVQYRS